MDYLDAAREFAIAAIASLLSFIAGRGTSKANLANARTSEMDTITRKYAEMADRAERAAERAERAYVQIRESEHECREELGEVKDRLNQLEKETRKLYDET